MTTPHHTSTWGSPPQDRNGFEVGIICALGLEFDAVRAVCDEIWSDKGIEYGVKHGDRNRYTTGRIGKHSVVLVRLTAMGKEPAARASAYLQMSFPRLRLVLLVGICGGVPMSQGTEIRLGDVVISHKIVEYDFGRLYPDGVDVKDADGRHKVDTDISAFVDSLGDGDSRRTLDHKFLESLEAINQKDDSRIYKSPEPWTDVLFHSKYRHKHQNPRAEDAQCRACSSQWDPVCEEAKKQSCADVGCDDKWLVRGSLTPTTTSASPRVPVLHFGAMGCGNLVIKCAENRDRIAKRKNVIAFEMESAGVFQTFAGVVVKGVCDYADSHKNKNWQFHAAATAAAATAAMLEQFTPSDRPQLAESSSKTVSNGHSQEASNLQRRFSVRHKSWGNFIGREHCLAAVKEGLIDRGRDDDKNCFVIHGMAGSGKTQVCLKVAKLHRDKFWGVFEVDASSRAAAEKDFASIAKQVGLAATFNNGIDFLTNCQSDWLLLLDNADSRRVAVSQLIPENTHGRILITTRSRELATCGTAGSYELKQMSPEESITLFLKEAGKDVDDATHRLQASGIVRELDYLPMALTQAAVPIRLKERRLNGFEKSFKKEKLRLMTERRNDNINTTYEYDSVYTSIEWSMKAMKSWPKPKALDRALEVLQICAFLHHKDIPEELFNMAPTKRGQGFALGTVDWLHSLINFRRSWGHWEAPTGNGQKASIEKMELRKALSPIHSLPEIPVSEQEDPDDNDSLRALGLLDTNALGTYGDKIGVFSMTPMVHEWNRARLDARSGRWARWAVGVALTRYINLRPLSDDRRRLLPHVDFFLATAEPSSSHSSLLSLDQSRVASAFSLVYQDNGIYSTALTIAEESMEGLKAARGDADPETLRGMNSTAVVLQNYREHSRAAELAKEVWKKRQEVLGENDEDTLSSLSTYALALHSLGQFSEAEDLNRHCLAARESTVEPNEAAIMDSANNLAVTLRRKGRYPEALELFRRALEWRELNLGPEHPKTIQTLSDLSSALRDAGEVEKATEPAQKALEILRRVLGDNHPSTLSSMVDLATILRKLGRIDEAEALSTEAEAGMRKRMGSTNPDTLDSMAELAAACMDRGVYEKAAELYQKVMDGYQAHFGEGHADLTRIRANLSFALKKLGRADKAEATYRGALAKIHPMHDDASKYKLGLAYLLVDQQEYDEATAIYQDIESCLEKSHPGPHDLKAECWYGKAVLLRSRQQYLEAGESMSRAADMFGQTLGWTSTLALNSLSIYAYLLDLQDRFEEAWPVYERSVAGYAVTGGPPTAFSKACEERFEAMKKRMNALGVSASGGGAGASSERSSVAASKDTGLSKAPLTAADGDPSTTGKRRAEPSDEPRRETANVKRPRTGATYRF